ncbi:MAG TPA: protein translocase subunit SecF [Candidatus Saccharimonadales bacterium]|nr:protein translocase subunit SecF [Candidatus Saccharimonadales bacterium]
MYDIVGKRNWYFAFSALITIPGLIFIIIGGLRPSVDFTGGTVWQAHYASSPSVAGMQAELVALGHPEAQVKDLGGGFLEMRTNPIDLLPTAAISVPTAVPSPSGSGTASGSAAASASPSATPTPSPSPTPAGTPSPTPTATPSPTPSPTPPPVIRNTKFDNLETKLVARFGKADLRSITTVGPIVGSDLIRSSIILIVIGELFILAYLWARFGFRFGTAAIVALLHDVVVVVGTFAILGYFLGLEFDALFVTALLTIIGFSVHDTIVVFDRIRENRIRHAGEPFGAIVNHSILQTLGRSINTSLTVVVTLTTLFLLGPATIRTFTLALLIGVASGTYSSIFNASQILVAWHEWDTRRKARATATRGQRATAR